MYDGVFKKKIFFFILLSHANVKSGPQLPHTFTITSGPIL